MSKQLTIAAAIATFSMGLVALSATTTGSLENGPSKASAPVVGLVAAQ